MTYAEVPGIEGKWDFIPGIYALCLQSLAKIGWISCSDISIPSGFPLLRAFLLWLCLQEVFICHLYLASCHQLTAFVVSIDATAALLSPHFFCTPRDPVWTLWLFCQHCPELGFLFSPGQVCRGYWVLDSLGHPSPQPHPVPWNIDCLFTLLRVFMAAALPHAISSRSQPRLVFELCRLLVGRPSKEAMTSSAKNSILLMSSDLRPFPCWLPLPGVVLSTCVMSTQCYHYWGEGSVLSICSRLCIAMQSYNAGSFAFQVHWVMLLPWFIWMGLDLQPAFGFSPRSHAARNIPTMTLAFCAPDSSDFLIWPVQFAGYKGEQEEEWPQLKPMTCFWPNDARHSMTIIDCIQLQYCGQAWPLYIVYPSSWSDLQSENLRTCSKHHAVRTSNNLCLSWFWSEWQIKTWVRGRVG